MIVLNIQRSQRNKVSLDLYIREIVHIYNIKTVIMNEEEKGRQYQSLMNHYVGLENTLKDIPKLSLEEQMKQVDVTNKIMYTESEPKKG